ncbi:MAG: ATP-binding cassette domain-containing protein, partial [Acholeplasmatales bacterium]|nr:ATP-binding cassette domain-containing protein [Acholeplasmatales bacterium]
TALNNILMPLKIKIKKEIKKDCSYFKRKSIFKERFLKELEYVNLLIDKLNIRHILSSYPSSLSGGEAQRVSIVRSLALRPKVLLLDEPTSALDPRLVNEVSDLINSLKSEDKIIIVVTHDLTLARNISDNVIFMKKANIIEQGNRDILDNPKSKELYDFLN